MPLQGKPLFLRQVERVAAARHAGRIIVATTLDKQDDPIEVVCREEGLTCFRGHATDLLDRHYQAALRYPAEVVIKIPSDCPLIDPAVIDRVIEFYLEHYPEYDFVSNLHPATYPDGNDVEIMTFGALQRAWQEARRPMEREHTTPYIWEHPELFRVGNVALEGGLDHSMTHRFTIDYAEDYTFIRTVFDELYPENPRFGMNEILALLARRPEIYAVNAAYAGVNWYRHHLDELKTVGVEQTKQI
jgi:spore coat polysaccharide biosynthesis protein SpsF